MIDQEKYDPTLGVDSRCYRHWFATNGYPTVKRDRTEVLQKLKEMGHGRYSRGAISYDDAVEEGELVWRRYTGEECNTEDLGIAKVIRTDRDGFELAYPFGFPYFSADQEELQTAIESLGTATLEHHGRSGFASRNSYTVKPKEKTTEYDIKVVDEMGGNNMLSKAKALYQVKLILDYLPQEEYDLIPQKTIDYIEENFEYDENITINPDIPLENQNIDDKTYDLLDKIINQAEKYTKKQESTEIDEYIKSVKESNANFENSIENIRLKKLVEVLQKENSKIPKAKDLLQNYKDELSEKNDEIQKLQKDNENLVIMIKKIPKFIRKIFIKESNIKLLNSGK